MQLMLPNIFLMEDHVSDFVILGSGGNDFPLRNEFPMHRILDQLLLLTYRVQQEPPQKNVSQTHHCTTGVSQDEQAPTFFARIWGKSTRIFLSYERFKASFYNASHWTLHILLGWVFGIKTCGITGGRGVSPLTIQCSIKSSDWLRDP